MPQPPHTPTLDIVSKASGLRHLEKVFVAYYVRPVDSTYSSKTSVVKSIQTLHIALDDSPALRAIKKDRLHIAIIDVDLGFQSKLF